MEVIATGKVTTSPFFQYQIVIETLEPAGPVPVR